MTSRRLDKVIKFSFFLNSEHKLLLSSDPDLSMELLVALFPQRDKALVCAPTDSLWKLDSKCYMRQHSKSDP